MKSKLSSKVNWRSSLALELLSRDLKNARSRQRARLKRDTNNTQSLEIDSLLYWMIPYLKALKDGIKELEKLENREQQQRKKLNNSRGRNFLGETYGQ